MVDKKKTLYAIKAVLVGILATIACCLAAFVLGLLVVGVCWCVWWVFFGAPNVVRVILLGIPIMCGLGYMVVKPLYALGDSVLNDIGKRRAR